MPYFNLKLYDKFIDRNIRWPFCTLYLECTLIRKEPTHLKGYQGENSTQLEGGPHAAISMNARNYAGHLSLLRITGY